MKILKVYNKKKFILSILGIIFSFFSLVMMILRDFELKQSILTLLIFLFSVSDIRKSISKSRTFQEKIEVTDERNNEIDSKSKALSFRICQLTVVLLEILFIILYGVYKLETFIWIMLVLGFIVFTTFISEFISGMYYDKKL